MFRTSLATQPRHQPLKGPKEEIIRHEIGLFANEALPNHRLAPSAAEDEAVVQRWARFGAEVRVALVEALKERLIEACPVDLDRDMEIEVFDFRLVPLLPRKRVRVGIRVRGRESSHAHVSR